MNNILDTISNREGKGCHVDMIKGEPQNVQSINIDCGSASFKYEIVDDYFTMILNFHDDVQNQRKCSDAIKYFLDYATKNNGEVDEPHMLYIVVTDSSPYPIGYVAATCPIFYAVSADSQDADNVELKILFQPGDWQEFPAEEISDEDIEYDICNDDDIESDDTTK